MTIEVSRLLSLAQEWRTTATRLELKYSGDVMKASKSALESCAEELEKLCAEEQKPKSFAG